MVYRRRIYFTSEQKSEIWDRWQRGESMSSNGRSFFLTSHCCIQNQHMHNMQGIDGPTA